MLLEITEILGGFDPQINFIFVFNNQLSIENFFSNLKTVFLISRRSESSITLADKKKHFFQNVFELLTYSGTE